MTTLYPSPWFSPLRSNRAGWWSLQPEGINDTQSTSFCIPTSPGTQTEDSTDNNLQLHFITQTYNMLNDPTTNSFIFWVLDGRSFMVRDVPEFSRDVLPNYLKQFCYSKFVLQLSFYGFRFRLLDTKLTEFAKEGFFRGPIVPLQKGFEFSLMGAQQFEMHPLKKVLTRNVIQFLPPGPSSHELQINDDVDGEDSTTIPLLLTKIHDMVNDPATNHIISWGRTGYNFIVWNPQELYRDLLPSYFKHVDYSKFVLQLCVLGFRFKVIVDRVQFEFTKEGFMKDYARVNRQKLIQSPIQTFSTKMDIGKIKEFKERSQAMSMQNPYSGKLLIEEESPKTSNEMVATDGMVELREKSKLLATCPGKFVAVEDATKLRREMEELKANNNNPRVIQGQGLGKIRKETEELKAGSKRRSIQHPSHALGKYIVVDDGMKLIKEMEEVRAGNRSKFIQSLPREMEELRAGNKPKFIQDLVLIDAVTDIRKHVLDLKNMIKKRQLLLPYPGRENINICVMDIGQELDELKEKIKEMSKRHPLQVPSSVGVEILEDIKEIEDEMEEIEEEIDEMDEFEEEMDEMDGEM